MLRHFHFKWNSPYKIPPAALCHSKFDLHFHKRRRAISTQPVKLPNNLRNCYLSCMCRQFNIEAVERMGIWLD